MKGLIFNIQRCSNNDGPGIRTTVFFKGCLLKCLWCHNPESQISARELMFFSARCKLCGTCAEVCPEGVHLLEPTRRVQFEECNLCGKCVERCASEALQIVGSWKTVEEIVSEVEKDIPFYKASNGGVTLSGGEPAMQPEFAANLCRKLKSKGLHVALDTSGYASWGAFEQILPFVDLIMLDIKHLNSGMHAQVTGAANGLILANVCKILEYGMELVVRFPLIPDYNDAHDDLVELSLFLKDSQIKGIEVVPYHTLGVPKYQQLGRSYPLPDLKKPTREYLNNKIGIFQEHGISVFVAKV